MPISVVTCCMNRNGHLARTLPQWLDRDWVEEVVVVDWSSTVPVAETLRDMPKDKIRVIRAEGEQSWALAYAYNLGVLHASGDIVLKADADCFVGDRLFADCRPHGTAFYAGETTSGLKAGKGWSVNGQCLFTRAAFEAVNGFNELLRSWGSDDYDFYRRLQTQGLARLEIDCGLLDFIPHSDDDRIANAAKVSPGTSAQQVLENQMFVQTVTNRVIIEQMPWGRWFPRARYRRLAVEGAVTRVERVRELEIKIPGVVLDFARLEAGRLALRQLGIDTGGKPPVDYATVLACFERWMIDAQSPPVAA